MPSITLTLPTSGTVITAGLHANNYTALQTLLNGGLDAGNWAAGKIFAPSKLTQEGAVALQGLVWDAPSSTWKPSPVQKYGTLIDIVSSVAETDILQAAGYTVPANTLGVLGSLRVKLRGDFLNNTGGVVTPVIRVYFGGTKIFDWTGNPPSVGASAARRPFRLEFDLANLNATNSQELNGFGYLGVAFAPTAGLGGQDSLSGVGANGIFADMEATSAIDTTAGCLLRVTAQLSSNSANHELRVRSSLIEFV